MLGVDGDRTSNLPVAVETDLPPEPLLAICGRKNKN